MFNAYEGWFIKPKDCYFKQALIEFKQEKKDKNAKIN